MKSIKNQKGFTLIELMAVIVILAVLVMVAIPAVTTYLDSARKGAFSNSAKAAVSAVRNDVIINGFNSTTTESVYDLAKINALMDKQITNSPFGGTFNNDSVKVKVTNNNGVYTYEMCMVDTSNNGFSKYTKEADITSETVKSPVTVEATDDCMNIG